MLNKKVLDFLGKRLVYYITTIASVLLISKLQLVAVARQRGQSVYIYIRKLMPEVILIKK